MTPKYRASVALAALMALSACGVFKGGGPKRTPTVGERVPILSSENAIEPDRSIADIQVLLPAPAANADWPQPGGNPAHSLGQLVLADSPTRQWQASINGGSNRERLAAAPVVADGKLFVDDVTATVHALAADTGKTLWSTSLTEGKVNRAARFGGGVSYDSGKVYATDGLGDVVALNAADGKEVWRSKPGGPLRGAPTVANGSVYVLSQDNQIFALSDADGKVQWVQSGTLESQGVFGVAAPASSQGTVVAGFSSGELNAYRYENGRVYAVGQGGRMVALDLATGQRLWEQNFAGISTPWIAGEWLFVVTDDARLICLARSNGKARWIAQLQRFANAKKNTGAQVTWFGPVLAGNKLVLTNSLGDVVFANPSDGSVTGQIDGKKKEGYALPPIVVNGTLYTLNQRGRITAYK